MTEENDKNLSKKIRESARQIWLAGLGAYNKAGEDTEKLFERLVKEGEALEDLTRGVLEKQIKVVEGTVEEVKKNANTTWDKLESVFDQRVSRALKRLGIPTSEDIRALEARIETLEKELEKARAEASRRKAGSKASAKAGTKTKSSPGA